MAGSVTRQVRAQLLQELGRDYVRTARSKGLGAAGVAISLAVLGWNLLGDGLRDALDLRLTE